MEGSRPSVYTKLLCHVPCGVQLHPAKISKEWRLPLVTSRFACNQLDKAPRRDRQNKLVTRDEGTVAPEQIAWRMRIPNAMVLAYLYGFLDKLTSKDISSHFTELLIDAPEIKCPGVRCACPHGCGFSTPT